MSSRKIILLSLALAVGIATFVAFRAGAAEASRVARQLPGLSEADVVALGRFEVAARVGTGAGSAISVVTMIAQLTNGGWSVTPQGGVR